MKPILDKHMPLAQNSSRSTALDSERKKDHYSHFILRLAFSSTEDLRRRFTRLESQLFKLRFLDNDVRDRQDFVAGLDFEWEKVTEEEKREYRVELAAVAPTGIRNDSDEGWFKVDWDKVPELVESRRVFLRRGKAFVPAKEQTSMVVSEFGRRLDQALEVS
jgi:DNA primase large subunit